MPSWISESPEMPAPPLRLFRSDRPLISVLTVFTFALCSSRKRLAPQPNSRPIPLVKSAGISSLCRSEIPAMLALVSMSIFARFRVMQNKFSIPPQRAKIVIFADGQRDRVLYRVQRFVVVLRGRTAHEQNLACRQILLFASPFHLHTMTIQVGCPRQLR